LLNTVDESEWRTRKERIDTRLSQCNPPWQILCWRPGKLDITWLEDDFLEDSDELPEPQDLAADAVTELEAVIDDLKEIIEPVDKEEGVDK
jgi:hypothetical protein